MLPSPADLTACQLPCSQQFESRYGFHICRKRPHPDSPQPRRGCTRPCTVNPLPRIIRLRQTHLPSYRYASSDEDVFAAGVPAVIIECIGNCSDPESARRAEGLGKKARLCAFFRRPSGLRANGFRNIMRRRCMIKNVNVLRAGSRQGLQRKWTAVCGFRPLLAPLKGETNKCRGRCQPDIVAESPTARRLCKGYRL